MISYLYTKIPLFLSAIKKEEKRREDIIVYNIHFFLLLAYKSNLFFIKQIKNQENINNTLLARIYNPCLLNLILTVYSTDCKSAPAEVKGFICDVLKELLRYLRI